MVLRAATVARPSPPEMHLCYSSNGHDSFGKRGLNFSNTHVSKQQLANNFEEHDLQLTFFNSYDIYFSFTWSSLRFNQHILIKLCAFLNFTSVFKIKTETKIEKGYTILLIDSSIRNSFPVYPF